VNAHVAALSRALRNFEEQDGTAGRWGRHLAVRLSQGGRLLAAGNGGSAAQAQHLTAELVGRYREDRRPFSALALHADTSSITAIANDYGTEEIFARQVEAHGRPGDVLILLSTSGASPNMITAANRARTCGLTVWALTGPAPNPLASLADDALCVPAEETATVQEVHLVVVHLICEALDEALGVSAAVREVSA
jgi:D-sedoheptulose 7-phosphate isomerase